MTASYSQPRPDRGHLRATIAWGATAIVFAGLFSQDLLAYFCVAIPVLIPAFLWLRVNGRGVPVLPIVSGLYFVYYAIPILRGEASAYEHDEVLDAAATVGSFLIAASIAAWPFLRRPIGNVQPFRPNPQCVRVAFVGLGAGLVYYLAALMGDLFWLGSFLGLVRAMMLTLATLGCFFLGCARAWGFLVGKRWALALGAFLTLILLSMAGLLLIEGTIMVLAAFVGYALTAKRLPWATFALVFAVLTVLQAGKNEMRRLYWTGEPAPEGPAGISQMPDMMFAWIGMGVNTLMGETSGETSASDPGLLERTSLLHLVLLVQSTTPDSIPYLDGETYAILPSTIIPRFLDPEKTANQSPLRLLSIRYNLESAYDPSTSIGWGLIAEAYANFGRLGVIVIGAIIGGICGALMRLSIGASTMSSPMLVTIASTAVLMNLEATFANLLTALAQSAAAAFVVAEILKFDRRQKR